MKRTLIVAAIATLTTGAALAQSSVGVYGRLNLTVESQKIGSASSKALANNASRIGFKGTEDLGGGLKTSFVIEHGFSPDDGKAAAPFWGREATIALSGGFGKVMLGNAAASESYFATADYVSMHNHDTGSSSDALAAFVATGAFQNSVSYFSPAMGGFNFAAQYGIREGAEVDAPLAIAANYDAGPLHLGLGIEKNGSAKSIGLRALYEMGAFTFGGYVERGSGNFSKDDGRFGTSAKGTAIRLAGMYAMGASEFHLNFGRVSGTDEKARSNGNQMTLGYNYNLSKRTKVYGYYTNTNLTGNASDFKSLAAGLRHNF
jgi:predicted porin